jgi:hypothetical protein
MVKRTRSEDEKSRNGGDGEAPASKAAPVKRKAPVKSKVVAKAKKGMKRIQETDVEDGEIVDIPPKEEVEVDEELEMQQLMGFSGFGSTKGKIVEDNQKTAAIGAANVMKKTREYRQYLRTNPYATR